MNSFETFKHLHKNSSPLLIGNVWDVKSAETFQSAGYRAIGISSQAISNALGYPDGENLPFEELLRITKRITEAVNLPLTVDMEAGYSRNLDGILKNIEKLHESGAVGINLEDTLPGEKRTLTSAVSFAGTVAAAARHIRQKRLGIFLNIRTDAFLLGLPNALEETQNRIKLYQDAGADGIFVPCITNSGDIEAVVKATSLPINVMCMPDLPGFKELESLGVKRISMGGFLFNKVYDYAGALARKISAEQGFTSIFS
ncbi:isocitrate lyase/PEP mutase family protein [Pedobacter sp. UBA5917]|jgi:2-methylisocitrate lyase-like PEP mutase family enzyme|uniref:isocitrate lyase/PEP mutase family protein n=1 Tax=Pedobacter sp. UBA5917 TaxID=1947061 RepID=UPI0025D490B8|nr:isocitrate lyase/phosphoenolpyruvate mutase family protein [Pedobacter sp. UBA5917]